MIEKESLTFLSRFGSHLCLLQGYIYTNLKKIYGLLNIKLTKVQTWVTATGKVIPCNGLKGKNFTKVVLHHECFPGMFWMFSNQFCESYIRGCSCNGRDELESCRSVYRSNRPEVFCKKVFLEIWQNSMENTCASGTGVFLWILSNF